MPWSYKKHVAVRVLITFASACITAFIGTFIHRFGAYYNIPIGLVLSYLLLGISTWCARQRDGAVGLAVHLIASSTLIVLLSGRGIAGDVLVPIGFSVSVPYFVSQVGYWWLYGSLLLQIIVLILPKQWFVLPETRVEELHDET